MLRDSCFEGRQSLFLTHFAKASLIVVDFACRKKREESENFRNLANYCEHHAYLISGKYVKNSYPVDISSHFDIV